VGLEQVDFTELLTDEGVAKSTAKALWRIVREQASETATEIGRKTVADAFGIDVSNLNHALEERNRARLSAEQLVYLQYRSKHDTLCAIVPARRGMQLVPQKPLTPEEECARWRSLADQMGIQGDWMKEQVYRRGKAKP
jgi:hypothetical protein